MVASAAKHLGNTSSFGCGCWQCASDPMVMPAARSNSAGARAHTVRSGWPTIADMSKMGFAAPTRNAVTPLPKHTPASTGGPMIRSVVAGESQPGDEALAVTLGQQPPQPPLPLPTYDASIYPVWFRLAGLG